MHWQEKEHTRIREELIRVKTDRLTGIYNYVALSDMIDFLKGTSQQVTIAMLDLAYFKDLNDRHGHMAGNEILKSFVELLEAHLHLSMVKEKVEIYRFGGEEFCLFFYDTDKVTVYNIIESFRSKMENYPVVVSEKEDINITFSAGIENSINHHFNIIETMKKADDACYTAKHSGRNKVLMWNVD